MGIERKNHHEEESNPFENLSFKYTSDLKTPAVIIPLAYCPGAAFRTRVERTERTAFGSLPS